MPVYLAVKVLAKVYKPIHFEFSHFEESSSQFFEPFLLFAFAIRIGDLCSTTVIPDWLSVYDS